MMRTRCLALLVAAAALLAGTSADAGVLVAATWKQTLQGVNLIITNSTFTCISTAPNVTGQVIGCSRDGLFAFGSSSATHYSVSLTVPSFTLSQFTTGGVIPIHTHATLSGAQLVAGSAGAAAGSPGVGGIVTVKAAGHTKKSMYAPGMSTLLKVPLSVGRAGIFTNYFYAVGVLHYITVDFYAWTPGTVTFTGLTSKSLPLMTPTVVAMGSFGLTMYDGGGFVTLVSPSKISIDGVLAQRRTASFTSLKLTYIPEPGTLLLLGAGVASLVLVGSRNRT